MTLKKLVVDCSTGVTHEIELTAEEIAQREADAEAFSEYQASFQAEMRAKEEARASALEKLAKLGLTEAEISALVQ